MLYDICHGYDGCGMESVFLLNFLQCGFGSLSVLHTVYGNNQTKHVYIALRFDDRQGLLDRGAGCGHILDDDYFISILDRAAQQDALVSVIFYFLTVRAVTDICVVHLADGHGCCNG